jgi:type I restriction enzyme, S subunit
MIAKPIYKIAKRVSSGITPLRSNAAFWSNGTIPWLKTEQLGEKYIYETTEKITEEALKKTSIKVYPPNTLSIAMYGEGKTRGNLSIIKTEMATNQACCNIELNEKVADYEYVYYFLKTQYKQLRNLSSGVRKNLNSNDIKNFNIRLPENLVEQKKIARIMSALDEKISINKQINIKLDALAKTLYDFWFVQFDFPDANGKPYKTNGGKMIWSEELKREIPDGWVVKKLSDWIERDKSGDWGNDVLSGNFITKVNCIRGADINGLNGLEECAPPIRYILEKNSNKILSSHDLIIEISGGSPTQSTGRFAYITEATLQRFEIPLICSNFCKAISLKNQKLVYNFAFHWDSLYKNNVFFGHEGKTSGIKNLLFESFVNSHWTAEPNLDVAERFYAFMHTIDVKKQDGLTELTGCY